jgi:gamma-glutamylcyclotransferase (GGCT)/AIG2-like uncharacterized protein YtfP
VTAFVLYGRSRADSRAADTSPEPASSSGAETVPRYRLYVVDALPALVAEQEGVAIACELYDVDEQQLQRLAEVEPPGWVRAPRRRALRRAVRTSRPSATGPPT